MSDYIIRKECRYTDKEILAILTLGLNFFWIRNLEELTELNQVWGHAEWLYHNGIKP